MLPTLMLPRIYPLLFFHHRLGEQEKQTQPASKRNMSTVGFIGIGIMGLGMCHNLIKSGRKLVVWNRSREAADKLAAEGEKGIVTVVDSPADVIAACGVTYSMLSTIEASEAVFPQILPALKPGKILVDCATLTVERMKYIGTEVNKAGALFLEAPVSGSKGPAEAGQLIFLAAGSPDVREVVKADFDKMGKATFYFGEEVGKGTKMKIVVNMIMGVQLNALAEGIALCEACGIEAGKLIEVLELGAMASPMIKLKGPAMVAAKYDPAFPLKHAQKDMRFAVQLADDSNIAIPVTAASNEQYKKARGAFGDSDFSAVVEASRSNKMSASKNNN